jgi:hypothetical protein
MRHRGIGLWCVVVASMVAAGCGHGTSAATEPSSSLPASMVTTTTAAWGEALAPGAESLVAGSRLLLREDFQDGDTAGWQVDSGWYLLSGGERRVLAAGGEAWAWYQDGLTWSRYAARFVLIRQHGSLALSVAVSAEGRYVLDLTDQGVYLVKDAPYGTYTTLGSAQPIAAGEPHSAAVGLDGGHLQVYLDGVLAIDAQDARPLSGGTVGVGAAEGSSVVVDNIVVVGLGGPLPQMAAMGESAAVPPPEDLGDGGPGPGGSLEGGEAENPQTPNLALVGVSYPAVIALDQPFDVTLTVANQGQAGAGAFAVAFTSNGDRCQAQVAGLAGGGQTTATCRFPGYAADGQDAYDWVAAADSGGAVDEGGREDDNLAAGTITVGGAPEEVLPNVSVAWVTIPEVVAPGEPVPVFFGIAQTELDWQGELPLLHFRMFYEDGSTACSDAVFEGDTGGNCEVPAFAQSGEYWLRMVIDANDVLAESNEDDNASFVAVHVSDVSLVEPPNLSFTEVDFDPPSPSPGQPFTATVWMNSYADVGSLPMYTLRLLIDGVVVCSADTDMTSGGHVCSIGGLPAGAHSWAAYVDADDDVAESNEADNMGWGQLTVGN